MARSKAQDDNLKKGKATRFKAGEKQAKIASKGGKASGEAKRRKKLIKECLDELLEKEYENKAGEKHTGAEAISISLFKRALAGDMKAFELVRDSAGQKPVDKFVMAEVDATTISEVEALVLGAKDDYKATGN